jgi:hypothetical protein
VLPSAAASLFMFHIFNILAVVLQVVKVCLEGRSVLSLKGELITIAGACGALIDDCGSEDPET